MRWTQSSYQIERDQGCLFVIPTPIGNLEDMTPRAIETLKKVDYIAAEDTRHTRKLLNSFQIETDMVSYHEHNQKKSGDRIIVDLKNGKHVALVSDAGMPGISDPGEDLIQSAIFAQIAVVALPGANAALTALIASGLSTERFTFYGFLNRHPKTREKELHGLAHHPYTLLFYESPHRLQETLRDMNNILGRREAVLVREISKKYEEYIRGSLPELVNWSEQERLRGEFSIVVSAEAAVGHHSHAADRNWWENISIQTHVQVYIEQGLSSKEAIKQTARERKVPKREVYSAYHIVGK